MDKATFIIMARNKYGESFDYSQLPDQIRRKPEIFICRTHGEFKQIPRDHLRSSHGCPQCAREAVSKSNTQRSLDFIEKSRLKFKGKFDYSKVDLASDLRKKVNIICPEHGMFKSTLRTHLHSKFGCAKCGQSSSLSRRIKYSDLDVFKQHAVEVHGDKYTYLDYDLERKIVTYRCPVHGIQTQERYIHLQGYGCRSCGYSQRTMTADEFLVRIKEIHPTGYSYDLTGYKTVHSKIKITHQCGKVYWARARKHLEGQGCKRCVSSNAEKRLVKFFNALQIEYIEQYCIQGYKYRYDFYLPEVNILIEYDGEQHAIPVQYFGGLDGFLKRKERDRHKTDLAKELGYILIRIPHTQEKTLENYLSRAIDKYFQYRVSNKFYKNFMELYTALELPSTTKPSEWSEFRTYQKLSLPR